MRRDGEDGPTPRSGGAHCVPSARIVPFAVGAAGIVLLLLSYHARTWSSLASAVAVCPNQFCDFLDYYYPMGEAIFRTALPEPGFLYSAFIAVLLAVFPPLGLEASLVLWGFLQVLFVSLYVFLFFRLVPSRPAVQLLFVALILSSYPILLNLMAGQVSVFIVVALLGMLVVGELGRGAVAAGLLALAVSFKFYPIIFLAPFVAGRNFRFLVIATTACVVVLLVIPGALLGGGGVLRFYGALFASFGESDWVVTNPHSQFLPHVMLRMAGAAGSGSMPRSALLHGITFAVAAANMGLVFLVQRARLRDADLWSFQLLFLTIPFVLKTSWVHDFVFLPFTQALLARWLLGGGGATARAALEETASGAGAWRGWILLLVALYVVLLPAALQERHADGPA
jgi:hypothetical protein